MTANVVPSGSPLDGYVGPHRSLILSGGGMRVAYQAGALRALLESGLVFSHADGTSGGIMNLAMLMSGLAPAEMCERWRRLRVRDFVSFLPMHEYLKGTQVVAMGDADGIVQHVFPGLGIDIGRIRAARGMVGTFNICNYTNKTNEAIPNDRVQLEHLVAGISLPIFMPPVQLDGELYVDSVWIRDANLMEAVRRGSDELWLIWCIGNTTGYHPGPFRQYVHMIELSANGSLFEDLERIAELNRWIEEGHSPYGQARPIRVHVVKPDVALPLDPDFYAGRIDAETLIGLGYQDAMGYLAQRQDEGVPLSNEATKMSERGVGVTFTETMEGPFAFGETDPQAGAPRGRTEGARMSFRANVDICDVDVFLADPEHLGRLVGEVGFAGPGGPGSLSKPVGLIEPIPSSRGAFNLVVAPGKPTRTVIRYEQGFEWDGKPYHVVGWKELRDDPGFDALRDATTMFVTLHEGLSAKDPVVGAGILQMTGRGFAKALSSVQVTNAPTIESRAKAAARFGRFFAGKVWETYA